MQIAKPHYPGIQIGIWNTFQPGQRRQAFLQEHSPYKKPAAEPIKQSALGAHGSNPKDMGRLFLYNKEDVWIQRGVLRWLASVAASLPGSPERVAAAGKEIEGRSFERLIAIFYNWVQEDYTKIVDAIKWAVQNNNAPVAKAIWAFLQTDTEVPGDQVFDVLVSAALQYSKYLPAGFYDFCATTVSLKRFVNAELVKMPRTAADFFELAGASKVHGDAPSGARGEYVGQTFSTHPDFTGGLEYIGISGAQAGLKPNPVKIKPQTGNILQRAWSGFKNVCNAIWEGLRYLFGF